MVHDQQVAVVTGASSGFGRLITYALAADGYQVFGGFRGTKCGFDVQAERLVGGFAPEGPAQGRGSVEPLRLDICDQTSVQQAIDEVDLRTGRIDVLVNTAGYGLLGPMETTPLAETKRLYETNVFGTMMMCQAVAPLMRRRRTGTILNVGSDVGLRPNFFQSSYAATKFAVDGFSQVLRLELAPFGIGVALIMPGWYGTAFGDSMVSTFDAPPYAEVYAPLLHAWEAGVNAVEGPNDQPAEVADLVRAAVTEKAGRYRYAVGWNHDRIGAVDQTEVDRYQKNLLSYYHLDKVTLGPPTTGKDGLR